MTSRALVDRWAAVAVALAYVVGLLLFYPHWRTFELDPDEGVNAIKALLLARGHALYAETWSDQPPFLTYALRVGFGIFGWSVEVGRMVVLAFTGLGIFALYDSLRRLASHAAALAAVALLPASSNFLYLSAALMVGLPAIALGLVSIWSLVRYRDSGNRAWAVAAGAVLGLSVITKLFTLVLAPIAVLWLLAQDRGGGGWRARFAAAALFLSALAGVVAGTLIFVVGWSYVPQLLGGHLDARRVLETVYEESDRRMMRDNLARDWEIVALAALGAVWSLARKRWPPLLFAAWALASGVVLSDHSPLWYHHHLLLSVPLCALAGIAIGELRAWRARIAPTPRGIGASVAMAVTAGLVATLALGLATGAKEEEHRILSWSERERYASELVREYAPGVRWAFCDRPIFAFRAGLPVPPNVAVMTRKRVATGNLTREQIDRTVATLLPEVIVLTWKLPWPLSQPLGDQLRDRYRLIYADSEIRLRIYARRDVAGRPLEALERAAQRVPNAWRAHDMIGLGWAAAGNVPRATASFGRALDLDPENGIVRTHLADTLIAEGRIGEGLEILRAGFSTHDAELRRALVERYAWRLATLPDPRHRNGRRALALLAVASPDDEFETIDALVVAAAKASGGDPAGAVTTLEHELEDPDPDKPLDEARRARIERHLRTYRAGGVWIVKVEGPEQ